MLETYPDLPKFADVEFIATIQQVDKAIRGKDTQAYKALMDSAYGASTQTFDMKLGVDAEEIIVEYID